MSVPAPTPPAPDPTELARVLARVELETDHRTIYRSGPPQMVTLSPREWAVVRAHLPGVVA